MNKQAIKDLATEWLNNPATEVYGRQLTWALNEPSTRTIKMDDTWTCGTQVRLWEKFERSDLEALKESIKALHYKVDHIYDKTSCCQCGQSYPCRTLKVLEEF